MLFKLLEELGRLSVLFEILKLSVIDATEAECTQDVRDYS